jgi:hypothetical protein
MERKVVERFILAVQGTGAFVSDSVRAISEAHKALQTRSHTFKNILFRLAQPFSPPPKLSAHLRVGLRILDSSFHCLVHATATLLPDNLSTGGNAKQVCQPIQQSRLFPLAPRYMKIPSEILSWRSGLHHMRHTTAVTVNAARNIFTSQTRTGRRRKKGQLAYHKWNNSGAQTNFKKLAT